MTNATKDNWQHEDIHDREAFEQSVRNFPRLVKRITGASDIDFLHEEHGHFLIIEGKLVTHNDYNIKYGQWMALLRLAKLSDKIQVYIVGEEGGAMYYIQNILQLEAHASIFNDKDRNNQIVVSIPLKHFKYLEEKQLEDFIYNKWEEFKSS